MDKTRESFMFTVGKLDAGMAILLGERAHLIEFPSVLLPPGATTGSIVNIAVHQNHAEERRREGEFWALQDEILEEFGHSSPQPPKLQLRNVTQTSVTLEWPSIQLATAKLRSLDIYRNNQRLAAIPSPLTNTSTKLSGLELNTEYTFQLILRTTAGTFPSNMIRMRTHTMTDTSGISVCFGNVEDPILLENAKLALKQMKAKWSDKIQIDTTHFVCTTPATTPSGAQATGSKGSAPGVEYQRALQLSIPVVQPLWILACHTEKKMVSIAQYYLGVKASSPSATHFGNRPQSMSQASVPQSPNSPSASSGKAAAANHRASMPVQSRTATASPPTTIPFSETATIRPGYAPTLEEVDTDTEEVEIAQSSTQAKRKSRSGTMNRDFKFPPTGPISPSIVVSSHENGDAYDDADDKHEHRTGDEDEDDESSSIVIPSSIEVPPPPPVEKERTSSFGAGSNGVDDGEDELGDTVDIPLN